MKGDVLKEDRGGKASGIVEEKGKRKKNMSICILLTRAHHHCQSLALCLNSIANPVMTFHRFHPFSIIS